MPKATTMDAIDLRWHLKCLDMSAAELSDAAGVSERSIWGYIAGNREPSKAVQNIITLLYFCKKDERLVDALFSIARPELELTPTDPSFRAAWEAK